MGTDGQHCSFVLLSEFDIDLGPKLTYQFPQPLGMDEGLLANLMLPDGAERQLEDWTIFFLNQTSFNTIAPVLALEKPEQNRMSMATLDEGKPELLYVLNLVRTKHDKTVKRGAVVKAMAICTRHPFIQIFKPVLLMALDDYYNDPSQDCLARLFDSVNSMDLSGAPTFSRHEKLILRTADRKDLFAEKFAPQTRPGVPENMSSDTLNVPGGTNNSGPANKSSGNVSKSHRTTISWDSRTSTEEGIVLGAKARDRAGTVNDLQSLPPSITRAPSPRGDSFSLDGSAVWVDGDTTTDTTPQATTGSLLARRETMGRGRRSTDASSSSDGRKDDYFGGNGISSMHAFGTSSPNLPNVKDTRSFGTFIAYKGHQLPIKMPIDTFPEEVGDYSLIQLISTFTSATAHVQGALHPHLHSNGSLTPPIFLLFNALITGKRIIFLGHGRPAGQVSSHVLASCALASGCGSVLRGFIERAFPYANLMNKEEWEIVPGFIAGVTNPIFESFDSWDVLCDISTGRIVVSKDIVSRYPVTAPALSAHAGLISRTGTLKAENSANEEEMGRMPSGPQKGDYSSKADNTDNLFIEDIISAIQYHFGENLVRARFQEYVLRFVRLASRYEEEIRQGQTSIGYPSAPYAEGRLGSGMVFADDASGQRELVMNASRIEGWMKTPMYIHYQVDFNKSLSTTDLEGFDVAHQIWRFRHARSMSDNEVELVLRTIASRIQSYAPVVELLSHMSLHQQGLLPLSFGLFHQSETVRELTVDIFNELRQYPVGVHFLHSLNHFQRYAFVRQAAQREARVARMVQQINPGPYNFRAPPNRSDSSLVQ